MTASPSSLYGESLFTSSRAKNSKMLFYQEHLERLAFGVEDYYLGRKLQSAELALIKEKVDGFLSTLGNEELRARFEIRAKSRDSLLPEAFSFEDLIVTASCRPLQHSISPVRLLCAPSPFSKAYPPIKMGSYMPLLRLKLKARRAGFDDALLTDENGAIIEGTTGNVFFYKCRGAGKLKFFAPRQSHLEGIIKQKIQESRPVVMADISLENSQDFDGAFLTNSVDIIRPVQSIDQLKFKKIDQQSLQNMLKDLLERGYYEKENQC